MFKRLFIQLGKKDMELPRSYENSTVSVFSGRGKRTEERSRQGGNTLPVPEARHSNISPSVCANTHIYKQFILIHDATLRQLLLPSFHRRANRQCNLSAFVF